MIRCTDMLGGKAWVIDRDDQLVVSRDGDRQWIAAPDLFAVVVVWDAAYPMSWLGWLTTLDHRAVPFTSVDVQDRALLSWLRGLPDWNPSAWSHATGTRGFHLVWRCPSSNTDQDQDPRHPVGVVRGGQGNDAGRSKPGWLTRSGVDAALTRSLKS
jgi:hypothetical protein